MEQTLVTGATGFLGRYVLAALAKAGARVRAFDVRMPQAAPRDVEWLQGDVRDRQAVRDACEGATRVIHLAGLIPQKSPGDATMWAVNVDGTQHVLDGARATGVKRVVYVSSAEVYGLPTVIPCPEDTPLAPQGVYGRSKVAAEKLCRSMQSVGVEVVILRPPTIIGPGLDEPFIVSLLDAVAQGGRVPLLGRGSNRFQMVHGDDMAEACLLAATLDGIAGRIYNIGATDVPPLRQVAEALIECVGSRARVISVPLPLVRVAMAILRPLGKAPLAPEHLAIATHDYVFDTSRAHRELGWYPRYGVVDALLDTYRARYPEARS